MKKSLVALAALAATGAFAQSSVEIYGGLDVGVAKLKGAEAGLNNTTYNFPASQSATALGNYFARSGLTTSFMGFRGTEDLGGGLKASFNLQTTGLDLSDGNPALAFSREAHLAVSGGFGTLKLGRSVSTMCALGCSFNLNRISTGDAYALHGLSPANLKASSRRSSQIEWSSSSLVKGLTVAASVILKGDAVADSTLTNGLPTAGADVAVGAAGFSAGASAAATKAGLKDQYAVGAVYAAGPMRVGFATETQAYSDPNLRNAQWFGAEYNFGAAIVQANYTVNGIKGGAGRAGAAGQASAVGSSILSARGATAGSGKGWGVGVAAPMGAATVGLQYADNTENKTKATEVFARYALSKRTELYGLYTTTSGIVATAGVNAGTVGGVATTGSNTWGLGAIPANPSLWSAGVRHTF